MPAISKSASYVRNSELIEAEVAKQAALRSICAQDETARKVWELLDTPQTVATLARRLASQPGEPPAAAEISDCLAELMHADLIQVSPDT